MTVARKTESNVQQAVPFFLVQDMERSVRFLRRRPWIRDDEGVERRG